MAAKRSALRAGQKRRHAEIRRLREMYPTMSFQEAERLRKQIHGEGSTIDAYLAHSFKVEEPDLYSPPLGSAGNGEIEPLTADRFIRVELNAKDLDALLATWVAACNNIDAFAAFLVDNGHRDTAIYFVENYAPIRAKLERLHTEAVG